MSYTHVCVTVTLLVVLFGCDSEQNPNDNAITDSSSPEEVLANPLVMAALLETREQGVEITTSTASSAPDVAGYYIREQSIGVVNGSSKPGQIGGRAVGSEFRINRISDEIVDIASVVFRGFNPVGFSSEAQARIRGEANRFTMYSRVQTTCTELGADFSQFVVAIRSGSIADNGDIVGVTRLSVLDATQGEETPRM